MSIVIQEQVKTCLAKIKQLEDQIKDLQGRLDPLEKKYAESKKTLSLPKNG